MSQEYSEEEHIKLLKQPCVAIYYSDNPPEYSETYQIVFNARFREAKKALVHDFLAYNPDAEEMNVRDYMPFAHRGIIIRGITYQTKPYMLGDARIGIYDMEYHEDVCRVTYTRENQVKMMENDKDKYDPYDYEIYLNALKTMSDVHYEVYRQNCIKNYKEDTMSTVTEEEANEKFIEFIMNADLEAHTQDVYIAQCLKATKSLKGLTP
jgi:hypothetical protein